MARLSGAKRARRPKVMRWMTSGRVMVVRGLLGLIRRNFSMVDLVVWLLFFGVSRAIIPCKSLSGKRCEIT